MRHKSFALLALLSLLIAGCATHTLRATGDLGLIIERADGSALVVENSHQKIIARVEGLGDLSHASVVYSRDQRYAYVFGRDGGLTKIDMLRHSIVKRVMQSGNSIGGAISQDGSLIAVGNYEPGGVKIFDSKTLDLVLDIPASYGDGKLSKIVGVEDSSDNIFAFSLYDAGEIWLANLQDVKKPVITKFKDIGRQPYDALISADGRHYIAGLFGEDGLAMLDLWYPDKGVTRILDGYGRGEEPLPVYKMPHLEGWALSEDHAYLPAIGRHELLIVNRHNWQEDDRISLHGQPIFAMARPDGRQVWVNFAYPDNDTVQVIDTLSNKIIATLKPGKAVLHMEFTPRGEHIWLSVRDEDRVDVYDTRTLQRINSLPARSPSGIFFTDRAHRIGL
ncbi:MAG: cytochrome D1 domain-containing protein [Thiohalomonadaceae bacterium]